MDAQRFLYGTVVGGVTLFVVGGLVYGLALANAYPATSIDRELPIWWALGVAQLVWGALLVLVLDKWPGGATAAGGFKAGAMIGFLASAAIGLGFYSMMTLPISIMNFVDPFIAAVVFGIGGAAVGLSLGRGGAEA